MMIGSAPNADDQKMGTLTTSNASLAIKRAKCYSTVMTLLPGVTWIYYGDELGMSSNYATGETSTSPHVDRWYRQPYKFGNETSGNADSDGVYQTGFSFTGGAGFSIGYDSYNKNNLKSAADQLKDDNSLLMHYSKITEIKQNKAFINGTYNGIQAGPDTIFAFQRVGSDGTYYVYVNFGNTSANISNKASGQTVYSFGTVNGSSLGAHSGLIIKTK
jgi:glycosidase